MNCAGGTRPRVGCSQRISASTALTCEECSEHLRLVVQAQLVAFHRAAQLAEQREVFLLAGVVVLVRRSRSPVLLRLAAYIAMSALRTSVCASSPVLGEVRDADAGAHVERLALRRGSALRARR